MQNQANMKFTTGLLNNLSTESPMIRIEENIKTKPSKNRQGDTEVFLISTLLGEKNFLVFSSKTMGCNLLIYLGAPTKVRINDAIPKLMISAAKNKAAIANPTVINNTQIILQALFGVSQFLRLIGLKVLVFMVFCVCFLRTAYQFFFFLGRKYIILIVEKLRVTRILLLIN